MDLPVLESIMEAAYDRYPKDKTPFFSVLTPREKKVVALGNLNYQVENGGFHQWVSNGYCNRASVKALREILPEIGTDEAKAVLEMVNEVAEMVDLEAEDNGCFGSYWLSDSDPHDYDDDDDYEDDCGPSLDHLDTAFYKINNALMTQAEETISKIPA